jgi:uncharacterized protein (TIGR03437 family)
LIRNYRPCILKKHSAVSMLKRGPRLEAVNPVAGGPCKQVAYMFKFIGTLLPLVLAGLSAPHLSGQRLPLNITISRTPDGSIYSPSSFEVEIYLTPTNTGGVWPPGMVQPTGMVQYTLNGNFAGVDSVRANGYSLYVFPGEVGTADLPMTITASYAGDATFAATTASISLTYMAGTATEQVVFESSSLNLFAGDSEFLVFAMSPLSAAECSLVGTLPTGMTAIGGGCLVLEGTPTSTGSYPITISGLAINGVTVQAAYTITVVSRPVPLSISSAPLPVGEITVPYTATLAATGGTPPYAWTMTGGGASGLTLSPTSGVYSGTPTSTSSSLSVQVTDSSGAPQTATATLNLAIQPLPTLSQSLPSGQVGVPYVGVIAVSGGHNPGPPTLASGTLPPGLAVGIGELWGIPTTAGTFAFTITVTDAFSVTASMSYSVYVAPAIPPSIGSLSPSSATAGGPAFTLNVSGTGFVTGAAILWNGTPLPTTFGSATLLSAAVPASLIVTTGTASITVLNPWGAPSNALTLAVIPPAPAISSLSPSSATAGGQAFTLNVSGTGFVAGAVIQWNGTPLPTTFGSATLLSAAVSASLIAAPGNASVTVGNSASVPSNALTFAVTPPVPSISSLIPSSATAGGPAFTLDVSGTGFVGGAVIQWNGTPLPTTFGSGTLLSAAVPTSLIAAPGSASITVVNSGTAHSVALTFAVTPPGPIITGVRNNYSYLLPGQPNYGIAPGTLFVITGSGLASATTVSGLQSSAAPGLPLSLNGASVSVTVDGVTTHPAFYYAIATQLALVLPSSTPVGTGTVTVTYNDASSPPAPITVLQSALGFDTLYGTGTGLGVATDNSTGAVFNYSNSAAPGQTIVLWGSGLGADQADSDTTFTSAPHPVNVPLQIYIGGIQAVIAYQGASGYPGVNQIDVTIPQEVQPGCAVAVVAVSGSITSNTITLPLSPDGGVCSDSIVALTGSQLQALGSETNYNSGAVYVSQATSSSGTTNTAEGSFEKVQGKQLASGVGLASPGSCIVNAATTPTSVPVFASTPLDAGSLSVAGPAGTQSVPEAQNTTATGPTGSYSAALPAGFIPATGGSFTFMATGGTTAGASVGAFTTTLSFSDPLVWSNMDSITAVNRAQGLTVTWTGGSSDTDVIIKGSSTSAVAGVIVSFLCSASAATGQFLVPSYILDTLPAGSGSLSVEGETALQSFSAVGLDYGTVYGMTSGVIAVPFN